MSYFRLLGFEKEPFSTSPDPQFFYLTKEHESALTNVLIELRLKRGLSVILGDVGTGKTSLSRKLIQCLKERGDFNFHMVMDPSFENEHAFLSSLVRSFAIQMNPDGDSTRDPLRGSVLELKEALERFLYQQCVLGSKSVVLVIDEAQKLTESAIEMLRVILNYETNENKLLQLVLLGQLELHARIMKIPNFFDRISFKFVLNPLGLKETKEMIRYRIQQAGFASPSALILDDAIEMIHDVSRGYPRKVTLLCHRAIKRLVMKNRWAVDEALVREIIEEDVQAGWMPLEIH
jgi:general secretion pathway protein A